MCKYCTCYDNPEFPSLGKRGFPIAEGHYEMCFIKEEDNDYCIVVEGSHESYSEPISFCPFCGKNLK